ncbi:hypothetical protein ACTPEW_05135 [Clostridioides difficile]
MKAKIAIIKRNFSSALVALIITLIVVILSTTSSTSSIAISRGNYTWLYIIMLPFFVVFYNFKKLINLGASKKDYYIGSMGLYLLSAIVVSLANTVIHISIDKWNTSQTVVNLMDLCGWWQNGILLAFLQQTMFLLMITVFLHVLLSIQENWYGWVTDIVIVAIICIFTPFAPLRHFLVLFFKLVMFNSTAWLHILICLAITGVLYFIGLLNLKNKTL